MPLISDAIGRVLGKRYRLVSAVGTGASAHVYLAEDVTLQRHVAVKVLQPGFARDQAFLERFAVEARAVASLNHPHVLRVFDWGEDADGPYLVLEYLGGGSLRDILDTGTRLSQAQAARLGVEVAQGLAYAHARGLVHRDVKPANLLFDEEGRVRIADFGVARALAEAAWTEPVGALVGTARYASPEQAEGRPVDGRSDVYSLALVLYESLTGTVPFLADTTVGTLRARIGRPLPPHELLGPLDGILARAAAPDVEARLDASQLVARLQAVAHALPAPEPLPLAPHEVAAAPVADGLAPTRHTKTVVAAAAGEGPGTTASSVARAGPGELFDLEALEGPTATQRRLPKLVRRHRHRRWPWVLGVLAAVLAAALGTLAATGAFTPSHPVPSLAGLSLERARLAVAREHLTVAVGGRAYSTTVPAGSVIGQRPRARTVVKEGSVVSVVLSRGLPPVAVPSLTGLTCDAAQRLLEEVHLKGACPDAAQGYSASIPPGEVINWSFDNRLNATRALYGGTVLMAISKGPPPVPLPSITSGETYGEYAAALQALGLRATQTTQASATVPAGQVIGTQPTGQAQPGSTVTVIVSSGPPMVQVPDVTKQSVPQATATLQAQGLSVGNVYGPSGGKVFSTDPSAGTSVQQGSSVNLYTK